MRRGSWLVVVSAVLLVRVAPLASQASKTDWSLEGIRTGFCVQFLLDPAAEVLKDRQVAPRPLPASQVKDLPLPLRGVVEARPEFASWSPSRLCFFAVDTVRASDFVLGDESGRRTELVGYWTVATADTAGGVRDVVLEVFAESKRLIGAGRKAGQDVRRARLDLGKVPEEDENGVPSTDDRFEVRVDKTTITWDGRLVGDSVRPKEPVVGAWRRAASGGRPLGARVAIEPSYARPMAGALKIDGKDALARTLRASPTRFAGPAYWGGGGKVTFAP
ncbi:MAG: hypothetical protein ABI860_03240 [Gemmatimonadales bacterium]